jgi:hypothetical protein
VAYFTDTQPPTVQITAPKPKEPIGTAAYVIEGMAADNLGVAAVFYNLNNSGWTNASTTNNYGSWFAKVTLAPNATNTLSAYAVDTSGHFSAIHGPIEFVCTAEGLAPLSVAGQLSEVTVASNEYSSIQVSFDSATYVKMALDAYEGDEVGTYTYTPTGPDSAELVLRRVLPTTGNATNGALLALSFTDAYTAAYTNLCGGSGTFSFEAARQSVPTTLDGVVLVATSFVSSNDNNYASTNSFDSSAFTAEDSLGGSYSGTYTFTPFTSVAALLVEACTNPVAMAGITNYLVLTYTQGAAPLAGFYGSDYLGASGELGSDLGSFYQFTSNQSSSAKGGAAARFDGPATLAGLQARVTPKGEPSFTRSFGRGTFASISSTESEPTDVGLILANTRVSVSTGMATFLALDPPYAAGQDDGTVDLKWKSNSSATANGAGANQVATLNFSTAQNFAPAALSGKTITATDRDTKNSSRLTFTNNIFINTGLAGPVAGTYTYAAYTPTMALVTATLTNIANAGETNYFLFNYESTNSGSYVSSRPDANSQGSWIFDNGVFSMK